MGLVLICFAGCGAKTGDVSGTVRFEGKSLPQGRITFYCEGGDKPVLTSPIADGRYSIQQAPLGNSKITVETFQIRTTRVPGQINSPVPDDVDSGFEETVSGEFVRIPERYRSLSESNLTCQIDAGSNPHDIDLEK